MEDQERNPQWCIITGSVQGTTHKSLVIPNQDAIGFDQDIPEHLPVILSVADGLGSFEFFRSDRGSKFAIQAAIEAGRSLIKDFPVLTDSIKDVIRDKFCKTFVDLWMELVIKDYEDDPPDRSLVEATEKRVSFFLQNAEGEERDKQKKAYLTAYPYSTTSITLIATAQYLIVVQIGNGDIVMIESDGQVSRPFLPILQDIGVLTLAIPQCWKLFDIFYRETFSAALPAAIFLSTDGYSNSYEYDFEKFLTSVFHNFFLTYEREAIQDGINTFLDRISTEGDGDDTTIGILYDAALIRHLHLSFPEDTPEPEESSDIRISETLETEKIVESETVCGNDFQKTPSGVCNNEQESGRGREDVPEEHSDVSELFEENTDDANSNGGMERSQYHKQCDEDPINNPSNNKKVT